MIERLKQLFRLKIATENVTVSVEEKIEEAFNSLNQDILRVEFGSDISNLSNVVLEKIGEYRENLKNTCGFILPPVHLLEKNDLQENEIIVYVRNQEKIHDYLIPNEENVSKDIYDFLTRIYENNLDEIFAMEYIEKYINKVQMTNSWLVWDVTKQLGAYEIKSILVNILRNKKSISDINLIFEKIDECLSQNRDCYHVWKSDIISKYVCKEM